MSGVHSETRSATLWLEIDNPARRNALSFPMMAELTKALHAAAAQPDVRVIVLRGRGDSFTAGADITGLGAVGTAEVRGTVEALFAALRDITKPVIAMIRGHCLGAGVALALAADLRLADPTATFAIPAARLGLGYPPDQTRTLVHTVGPAVAADLLYTGRTLPAHEAAAVGLVNSATEAGLLEQEVARLADEIAGNAPLAVRAAKAGIRAALNADAEAAREAVELVATCQASQDVSEGRAAFLARRIPRFTGQ